MSMSLNRSSNDPRGADLLRRHQKELSRFFVTFAVIEGLLLVSGIAVVYLFELVDPEQGIWILVAIAAVGGFFMSAYLVSITRRHARERRDIGLS